MTYRPVDATSGWTQVWNGENRMVETYKGIDRLTFQYDYMGRRVEKCVYSNNTLTSKTLFVYDGFKCVEELDGLNNNTVLMRHTWQPFDVGLDVILATTDGGGTCCFLHDANKNIVQKNTANGALLEKYTYAPFGKNAGVNNAHIGFSSEVSDDNMGICYFNYRYLDNSIGRWIRREPLDDLFPEDMYSFLNNNAIYYFDLYGLFQNTNNLYRIIIETKQSKDDNKLPMPYFEAYPQNSKCQCEPCEKQYSKYTGKVYLIQYIRTSIKKNWEVDSGPNRKVIMPNGNIRVPGYTDQTPISNGGRKSTEHPGGIIDMPGASVIDKSKTIVSYHKFFRIEAYCRCVGKSDKFLNTAVEFEVKRYKNEQYDGMSGLDIYNIRNYISNNSVYPSLMISFEKYSQLK